MQLLKIDRIRKSFGKHVVLDDVSFNVVTGERKALIGPNGAGKTTLFNVIMGEFKPDAGSIAFLGNAITALPPYKRALAGLGRTFQRNTLFFNLSVLENLILAFGGGTDPLKALRKGNRDSEIYDPAVQALKEWELWPKRNYRVGDLSYGEQRQLEVLLALASKPKLLLLDEPSAGMSAAETEAISSRIGSLPSHMSVLIIEHDMEVVFRVAHNIVVLNYGTILVEGTAAEVKADERVREVYFGKE